VRESGVDEEIGRQREGRRIVCELASGGVETAGGGETDEGWLAEGRKGGGGRRGEEEMLDFRAELREGGEGGGGEGEVVGLSREGYCEWRGREEKD